MPRMYAYNNTATPIKKRYAMIGSTETLVKKRYAMIGNTETLVYNAQSDSYTITASAASVAQTFTSRVITNTDKYYAKMVIESVSASGGNYGPNRAHLWCNGKAVLDTGVTTTPAAYRSAVNAWSGSFDISQNGTVYVDVWTEVDSNIDDFVDTTTVSVTFHFE